MFHSTPELVFHVQAGARIGMGHLARARALMSALQDMGVECALHLDADAQGSAQARDWGLGLIPALPDNPSALVIDAISVGGALATALQRFSPRILISPVCDRADIATHALLRAAPPALSAALSKSVMLQVKSEYAFVTAHGLSSRALDFSSLDIGLCLSGGADPMGLGGILSLLDGLAQVSSIRLIDSYHPTFAVRHLRHVPKMDRPWLFLDGINLFIGGEGVMLAEAIAQGLPAISLGTSTGIAKNASLLESGALRMIARDGQMLPSLSALLRDRPALESMHRAALQLNGAASVSCLAHDISTILKETAQ